MDFTFRQLQIFRAVVVAGSITKASRRIDLSQPSISQQLAKLEENLGVQLISRTRTGSVALTPAGEFWYRSAVELMDRVEVIAQEHDRTFRASNLVLRLGSPRRSVAAFCQSQRALPGKTRTFRGLL